jgi:predicted nucleotidyltransferase
VYGSHARREATPDSDVEVLLVVEHSDEPRYRRGQAAYAPIGPHVTPVDILVVTRDEFERALDIPSAHSATV